MNLYYYIYNSVLKNSLITYPVTLKELQTPNHCCPGNMIFMYKKRGPCGPPFGYF
jgi:hypothetical protein